MSVQLTQHGVRDEKKTGFTVDQFHMVLGWSKKTVHTSSTPASDTSYCHEMKLS